jgi:hypothetical protein
MKKGTIMPMDNTSIDYLRDVSATTAWIFCTYYSTATFFTSVDKATDIAIKFIEKHPTGTDWEKTENTWEETLYYFCEKELK